MFFIKVLFKLGLISHPGTYMKSMECIDPLAEVILAIREAGLLSSFKDVG